MRNQTSSKIIEMRVAAGNKDTYNCPTCTRPHHNPYTVYGENGEILEGCVDAAHTEYLTGVISAKARWHFRPQARAIRAQTLKHLRSL